MVAEPYDPTPLPSSVRCGGGKGVGRRALFVLGGGMCLTPWASPPLALAAGMALALAVGNPYRKGGHRCTKWLLQGCVVALGFGMDLPAVVKAGAGGAVLALATISATLLAGRWLGRRLGMRPVTAALISAGTAICGGSAIAAVGSALEAEEGDMTVAMGTVFLLNAAALYLFPVLGHLLGLGQESFGVWAGVGIHDVSSVVGAAGRYGAEALQTATAVKLSRALWIVPLTFGIAFAMRGAHAPVLGNAAFGFQAGPRAPRRRATVQVPWFILLFLVASVARSTVPGVAAVAPALTRSASAGLTLTLFLIGAGLTRDTLARVGFKALVHGLALWSLISALSLVVILCRH